MVLFDLYKTGKISLEQALINADSANNLRLKIKLAGLKTDEDTPIQDKSSTGKHTGLHIKGSPRF